MPNIARPSVASLLVIVKSGGVTQGNATGFLVSREGADFLITNRHVVRGLDGIVPDCLTILHNRAGTLGTWDGHDERLYDADGDPLWWEHPTHPDYDVVALRLTSVDNVDRYGYDPWNSGPDVRIGVTDGLSIIGFPFGITGGGAFGVWARGFVATEPEVDWQNLPVFLIDSRTRKGQSGSPVIFYQVGGVVQTQAALQVGTGVTEQFLGVYSGRINAESDLGFVWKAVVAREVIEGAQRAEL